MSRRRAVAKRNISPDAKFNNVSIARFINYLMVDGKKYVAESIAYKAINILSTKLKKEPVYLFEEVVENLKPNVEVRSKRVGGSTYQIPVEVRPERQVFKSLKWLIESAKKRTSEKTMIERLSSELYDAYHKKGLAYKKKEDTHKMAESNKAFSHFRF